MDLNNTPDAVGSRDGRPKDSVLVQNSLANWERWCGKRGEGERERGGELVIILANSIWV